MKSFLIIALIFSQFACTTLEGQDHKDVQKVNKSYNVSSDTKISVYNLNGNVTVSSHSGANVEVEIIITAQGKTEAKVQEMKSKIKLGENQSAGILELFQTEPHNTKPHANENKNWDNDHCCNDMGYNIEYILKIPKNNSIFVSTVNGDIDMQSIDGISEANSVNGEINMTSMKNVVLGRTVNGDVNVSLVSNVSDNATFKTINGDINITAPTSLSAKCAFKSMNGDFYTDFENIKTNNSITKSTKGNGGKSKYKIDKTQNIVFGAGNANISFETLNGDVFLKKS